MSPEEPSSKDAAVIDDDLVEALGFEPTTAIENVSDLADDGDVADDDGDAALDDLLDDAVVQDDLAADLLFEPVSDEASDNSGEGADEALLDLDGLNGEVEDDLEVAADDVTLESDDLESGDLDDDGMALAAASLLGVASVQSIEDDSASDDSASDDSAADDTALDERALDESASDDSASDIVDLDLLESQGSDIEALDLDDADAAGSDDVEMTSVDTAVDTDADIDPDAHGNIDPDAEGSDADDDADDERTEAIELSGDDASVLPPPLFEETIDLTAGDVAVADPEVDVFDLEKVEDEPDVDVAPTPTTAPTTAPTRRRKQLRARKSRRVVRHIDPWSVLTFSVLFHLCFFAAMLLASVLVWNAADAAGTIDNIEEFIIDLGDYDSFEINGDAVFKAAMLIAGMLTLASSIMVVLLTVVFNLISGLVGGIRVTVIEEETVRVVSSGRRK